MAPKTLPQPVPVLSPRGLITYAIGAVFRSVRPGAEPQALRPEDTFSFEAATHTVRGRNAGDAMRAFLSSPEARMIERWLDDERSQRLLYIIPVERLMFSRPTAANIETSTTHRHDNGASICYLRG